jgi:hypothetical protein
MRLWGREYTREALLQRVGRLDQIGGVEAAMLDEGPERGVRALRFTAASGLTCTVLPDRGMDIADFRWQGRSLCWHGEPGRVSPALFHPFHDGFARAFFGGMLTTCGLTNFGPGEEDAGELLSQHGLIDFTPATSVAWGHTWEGDRCTLYARGMVRQVQIFGENLTLTRHLRMDLDGQSLLVEDVVRNEGWQSSPHMILYHCNAGFPLLDETATLHGVFKHVTPRDASAERDLQSFDHYLAPQPGWPDQVFVTELSPDDAGWAGVTLWNGALGDGLGLRLRWDATTLPWLHIWRMLGQGMYALGLEPANCPEPAGRAAARAAGVLPYLAPGEERRYRLEFTVVTTAPA